MVQFLLHGHDPITVLMALGMCVIGSLVTARLWRNAMRAGSSRRAQIEWCLLAGVAGGASIWSTHFIAMLGDQNSAFVGFNAELTISSIIVAVAGVALSLVAATARARTFAIAVGGPALGLSIAAMHYVGMAAYNVQGIVTWSVPLVVLSVVLSIALATVATALMRTEERKNRVALATAALVAAILALHFVGMAALGVIGGCGFGGTGDGTSLNAIALATFLCGAIVVGMGFCSDTINDRVRTQSKEQLIQQALYDPLTALANRRHFQDALAKRFEGPDAPSVAIMLLDLDRFKAVNDTLGHRIGDVLLKRVGARIQSLVGERGLCARIGGDEFAVLLAAECGPGEIGERAASIIDIVSRPYVIEGKVVEVGVSIGVARAPDHGDAPDVLSQNADVALYTAKDTGRARFCIFEPGMMTAAQARKALEVDLRRALVRAEFSLSFQPLSDPLTKEYTGAEALLRWEHPERGMVSPGTFIPLAEELGLIVSIGEWVLREACAAAAQWPQHMRVAVNVSPVQMTSHRFLDLVFDTLAATGLPPSRLELEITETTLLKDDGGIVEMLHAFNKAGISIALDDFGTGYSSLTSLHRYPIDRIKIDRSFLSVLDQDEGARNMVRAISTLGQILGVSVTAEGIETVSQHDFAAECGCGPVQGYYIGRPVPRSDLPDAFRPRRQLAA